MINFKNSLTKRLPLKSFKEFSDKPKVLSDDERMKRKTTRKSQKQARKVNR